MTMVVPLVQEQRVQARLGYRLRDSPADVVISVGVFYVSHHVSQQLNHVSPDSSNHESTQKSPCMGVAACFGR